MVSRKKAATQHEKSLKKGLPASMAEASSLHGPALTDERMKSEFELQLSSNFRDVDPLKGLPTAPELVGTLHSRLGPF